MTRLALLRFAGRRIALLSVVLLLVSILIFAIVQVLPGDVATMILGTYATPEDLTVLRQKLGLTRPAPLRYFDWISGAVQGRWGTSLVYQVPVRSLVLDRLKRSGILATVALTIAVPTAILLGVVSAWRRDGLVDHLIGVLTLSAVSMPEFVSGVMLILLLAYQFPLLPPSSLIDPTVGVLSAAPSLILPVLTLVLALLAHMTRMTRASMIEALEKPFVRAARLRGLRPRRVVLEHALRNALLPTVGVVALNVGYAIGGLVVVETVFAYPGLGRLLVDSINNRDVPVIQMTALVVATAYALANLAADVVYAYLDPRIRV